MGRLLSERAKDRTAGVVIRAGGILVILVVVAIVVNIGWQAFPLFIGASSGPVEEVAPAPSALAVGAASRGELLWALRDDGGIEIVPARDDLLYEVREPLMPFGTPVQVAAARAGIHGTVSAVSAAGTLVIGEVRFRDRWDDAGRVAEVRWRSRIEPLETELADAKGVAAAVGPDGDAVAVLWNRTDPPRIVAWSAQRESWRNLPAPPFPGIRSAAVAEDLSAVALVHTDGSLRVVLLPEMEEIDVVGVDEPLTGVQFVIGGGTLVAAGHDGSLSVLLRVPHIEIRNTGGRLLDVHGVRIAPGEAAIVPDEEVGRKLASREDVLLRSTPPVATVVRRLPSAGDEITALAPSHRRRGLLVGTADGFVSLYHTTSARRLLHDRWGDGPVSALAMTPKSDGAVALIGDLLLRRSIDNPHPEVSLRTLFLPVWYEGYAAPDWVWQTTGGSDAFEPKMSLWPLIFGTLKATLYAMLISVPLALAAAVYVSQLAPPWLQSVVKPTLELMAAVPSVVVGFLAALWLAPRLEQALFPALMAALSLPLAVVAAVGLWRLIPGGVRRRVPAGGDLLVLLLSTVAVVGLAVAVAGPLEEWLFGGDLQRFLFTEAGIRYDQRNSLVVGLALGFAVIPVIFTIAEDACSAVPRSLVTASRALGATRWQTAIRLVVPAASPGLFAAVVLGFGRAVGETMIVLMAAGNTPLLDMSPFNGMRTMSAAIAVEIPEAPVGGTLFRVLFLTGTLLFAFTLILTTLADLVGTYLRKRYARF